MQVEKRLCQLSGRHHALMFKNGSAALLAALLASGRREVLIPSNTCFAVLGAAHMASMHAHFGEMEHQRFQMQPQPLPGTSADLAVVAIHSLGLICNIEAWEHQCQESGSFLIEDACLALGGRAQKRAAGNFGQASVMSFGYDKIIDAGGGGALLTDDERLFGLARQFLRNNPFFECEPSLRPEIERRLDSLDEVLACRRANAEWLDRNLGSARLSKPVLRPGDSVWRYSVMGPGCAVETVSSAACAGIAMTTHYRSLHLFRTGLRLPGAEELQRRILNIFIRPGVTREYLERTAAFLNSL